MKAPTLTMIAVLGSACGFHVGRGDQDRDAQRRLNHCIEIEAKVAEGASLVE